MKMEKTKDEIRMNWNKKVSMREIAQFYEEKLRELDSKQSLILSDLKNRLDGLTRIIQENEDKANDVSKTMDQLNSEADSQIKEMKKVLNEFKGVGEIIKNHDITWFEEVLIDSRTAMTLSELTFNLLNQYFYIRNTAFYSRAKERTLNQATEGGIQVKDYLESIEEIPGIEWVKVSKEIDKRILKSVEGQYIVIEQLYKRVTRIDEIFDDKEAL